jgi:superfamily II DNA or RNA helicase
MKLRDYQEQAVKRARLQFKNGSRVLFSLPTGGGKTIISHEIIRRAYEKNPELVSLFLTNRRVLAEQAKDTFVANGLRASLFMHGNALPDVLKSDEINETSEQVIVISYQTMLAALNKIEHPLVKECLGNGVPLLETIATS